MLFIILLIVGIILLFPVFIGTLLIGLRILFVILGPLLIILAILFLAGVLGAA
jgi:hypothetical protein